MWLLYCLMLFSAPLIGMLLSNGFAYLFFHVLFLKFRDATGPQADAPRPEFATTSA